MSVQATWRDVRRRSRVRRPRAGVITTDTYTYRFVVEDVETFRVETDTRGLVSAGREAWLVRHGTAEHRQADPPAGQALLLATMLWPQRFQTGEDPVVVATADDRVAVFELSDLGARAHVDVATGTIVLLLRPDGSTLAEITRLRVADRAELRWDGAVQSGHTRDGIASVTATREGILASWQWTPGDGMPGYIEAIPATTLAAAVDAARRLSDRVIVATPEGEFDAGTALPSDPGLPRWHG